MTRVPMAPIASSSQVSELGMALPKRDHREHGEARERWTSSVVM